jgi:copper chaperone CopZ
MSLIRIGRRSAALALAVACVLALGTDAAHAANAQNTVITVDEMCSGCVRNITKRMKKFPDVSTVKCNMATRTVTIAPKAGKTLSPRTLWEAMQGVGNPPKKLVGPTGTFTSKPKE